MVIAEGCLATLVRTTSGGPATTLVIDKLRPVRNNEVLWNKNRGFEKSGLGFRGAERKKKLPIMDIRESMAPDLGPRETRRV